MFDFGKVLKSLRLDKGDREAEGEITTSESTAKKIVQELLPATEQIWEEEVEMECRERPTAIKEVIRPKERIEEQTIVHRERITTEIRQITHPMHQTRILPTQIHEEVLPELDRGEFQEPL